MARRSVPSLVEDRARVISLLQQRGVMPATIPSKMADAARIIHEATFSLILWKFRLRKLPAHGEAFIEEIASDALQILPQIMMGYGKTAKLLIRCIIENSLRHVYFSDHPIEFSRMNRDAKWFLTFADLVDYAKNHPTYLLTEGKFDAINRITTLFSELSAGIHGRAVADLEMRASLSAIVYEDAAAAKEAELVRRSAEAVNFMLAIFHHKQLGRLSSEDRKVVMRTMPPKAREAWRDYEP
jgi:hypothetical protein